MSTPSRRPQPGDSSAAPKTHQVKRPSRPLQSQSSSSAAGPRGSQFAPAPRFVFSSSAAQQQQQQQHQESHRRDANADSRPLSPRYGASKRAQGHDEIDDSDPASEGGGYYSGDENGAAAPPPQTHAPPERSRRLQDAISDTSSEQGSVTDELMLLDSAEQVGGDGGEQGLPRQRLAQKRRHPSSSPPTRDGNTVIRISSSPTASSQIPDDGNDEPQTDDLADLDDDDDSHAMFAAKRPNRHRRISTDLAEQVESAAALSTKHAQALSKQAAHQPPSSAMRPPSTPARPQDSARFRFATPLRAPYSSWQTADQTPVRGLSGVEGTPAAQPSTQTHAPRFTLPSSATRHGDDIAGNPTQENYIPLPDIFSPQKRGSRFMPGGMAEAVRDMVLEAGGQMHVAATRKIKVQTAQPLGENGALLVEAEEMVDGKVAVKGFLLVGADAHIAAAVRPGDTVGIKHGWYLPAGIGRDLGISAAGEGDEQELEVSWGPV